jgi:hypothetical protein
MATCNRCGAETQLYDIGYPICTACSADSLAKPVDVEKMYLTPNDVKLGLPHE